MKKAPHGAFLVSLLALSDLVANIATNPSHNNACEHMISFCLVYALPVKFVSWIGFFNGFHR